ncbi:hypothetical protein LEP1GSC126_0077 [Leptospira kirschneri str. 200801774]|uniref:hypothetical protein n=1 Tax=Leptospira kirschneri TaxID=29507 RepID=UPI0002BF199C|nr:hypothetical protein [Leptospira kirschneri]EMO78606.1 hypothetical protein LEP1GSC126_0077 [Leptospira kirschneri str. 200801774]
MKEEQQPTSQERREYIANNILGWKILPKRKGDGEFYVMTLWTYNKGKIISMPKQVAEELPDFESLLAWVGPLCEEIFPMLAKKNWHISFLNNGHVSLIDSRGKTIGTGPLSTVLVDAHMKITRKKRNERNG